jgi:hypothetical protein
MLIFDFFAGTGSSTQAFLDNGHKVIRFELDQQFKADEHVDIMSLRASDLIAKYGKPDFIWASPPCTAFSVASIGHYWHSANSPKNETAKKAVELVRHTRNLIEEISPTFGFLIENPRGMLRKLDVLSDLERRTVTYCQYGDSRMKPTDLWGGVLGWAAKAACKNGDDCHESAPRGSRTGTQGLSGARARSMVPYELGLEILDAIKKGE